MLLTSVKVMKGKNRPRNQHRLWEIKETCLAMPHGILIGSWDRKGTLVGKREIQIKPEIWVRVLYRGRLLSFDKRAAKVRTSWVQGMWELCALSATPLLVQNLPNKILKIAGLVPFP